MSIHHPPLRQYLPPSSCSCFPTQPCTTFSSFHNHLPLSYRLSVFTVAKRFLHSLPFVCDRARLLNFSTDQSDQHILSPTHSHTSHSSPILTPSQSHHQLHILQCRATTTTSKVSLRAATGILSSLPRRMAAHHLKDSTTALPHLCSTNSSLLLSSLLVVVDVSRAVLLPCAAASSAKRAASAAPSAVNAAPSAAKWLIRTIDYKRMIESHD